MLLSPGYVTSFLPVCADSKFPRSGEERLWSRFQNQQSLGGHRAELSTDISALCPLQDPRKAYLRPR